MERSRLSVSTKLGFAGEDETPIGFTVEPTEPGEVRVDMAALADYNGAEKVPDLSAYLSPTDAAILGHLLIEASRSAVPPVPGDEQP